MTIIIQDTDNLKYRIKRHNLGLVKATKAYKPWELKYYEIYETRGEAMKREKSLKKQKSKEFYERLINQWRPDKSGRGRGIPPEHRDVMNITWFFYF